MLKQHPTKGHLVEVAADAVHPNLGPCSDWPDPPDLPSDRLGSLTGDQLADECRARGLPVGGTKDDKIVRLHEYESGDAAT